LRGSKSPNATHAPRIVETTQEEKKTNQQRHTAESPERKKQPAKENPQTRTTYRKNGPDRHER
jgi:hypothetical protein